MWSIRWRLAADQRRLARCSDGTVASAHPRPAARLFTVFPCKIFLLKRQIFRSCLYSYRTTVTGHSLIIILRKFLDTPCNFGAYLYDTQAWRAIVLVVSGRSGRRGEWVCCGTGSGPIGGSEGVLTLSYITR